MQIEYHDLSDKDFERLVVAICMEILGPGVASFSSGKDGSRDARFEGMSLHMPSSAIQHIITVIDSELPTMTIGKKSAFEPAEIIVTLSDEGDSGHLFKMPAW